MRTDPTDNGGLFIGRRPGTAPVRYRGVPERGSLRRQRADGLLAIGLLALMTLVGLSFWGPVPVAWLWVASQLDFQLGSITLALIVGFLGMLLTLLAGLVIMKALDRVWILVRRAAGHDQREGAVTTIFWVSAVVGTVSFTFWLLFIGGLGSTLLPSQ